MNRNQYVIRGGADGRQRLHLLARITRPGTEELFERVGIKRGWSCLDVGCGGGDLTLELAERVGPDGQVDGIDIDPTVIDIAQQEAAARQLPNVSYRCANADDLVVERHYDLVYSRFLLSHLPHRTSVLKKMTRALKYGGVLITEDIDFSGNFCYPDSPAFRRYVELYTQVVQKRGGDPLIGPRLPVLLLNAGCADVRVHVEQPAALDDETKFIDPLTCEYIADSLVAEGLATQTEVNAIVAEMYEFAHNPKTVVSMPRVIQSWGYRTL